jgi:hypothetical protein
MELLDRYLQAIRKHLPWDRQDDIIAELRANLESQLEEKEDELGRPLTQAEAEAWLKQLGAPIQVAAGYQTQRYLIGPGLFPIYRYVLQLAGKIALIVYAVINVAMILAKQDLTPKAFIDVLVQVPFFLLTTAAWVTLVFATIEYVVARGYVKLPANCEIDGPWSLNNLPEVRADREKRPSYAKAVAEAIFSFLWLVYLLLIPQHPFLILGPGAWYLKSLPQHLAPVWVQFYWALVALNIVQFGWRLESLWSGRWQRPQPLRQVVFQVVGLIPVGFLLAAPGHVLVALNDPATAQPGAVATLDNINHYVYTGFQVIFLLVACKLMWDVAMLWRDYFRNRPAVK